MTFNPVQTNQRPIREKLTQRVWEFVCAIVFRCSPWFARKWRMAWLRFASTLYRGGLSGVSKKCSIARTVRIDYPWNFSIGDSSSVGERTWIYCLDKIVIGKNCCIGNDVRLLAGSHDVSSASFNLVTDSIIIGDNVWIATGVYVIPGVTIGEGAVVAAGSVVTKDVEPWTVVGGNPAKFIKKRELKNG